MPQRAGVDQLAARRESVAALPTRLTMDEIEEMGSSVAEII